MIHSEKKGEGKKITRLKSQILPQQRISLSPGTRLRIRRIRHFFRELSTGSIGILPFPLLFNKFEFASNYIAFFFFFRFQSPPLTLLTHRLYMNIFRINGKIYSEGIDVTTLSRN